MCPLLKQFADLTEADFDAHPIWIGCHCSDYDEPWYEETDEETHRAWTGDSPVDASADMFLVRASLTLADGSRFPGFVTPSEKPDDPGTTQPHLFHDGAMFYFWGGMIGVPTEDRARLYQALGRSADQVFPIRFAADPGLATGHCSGTLDGFYSYTPPGCDVIECSR